MNNFKKISKCRICKSKKIAEYLDLGNQPLANSFLTKKQIPKEKKYPLKLVLCKDCSLSQLSIAVNPKIIFNDYDYLSSSSKALKNHYSKLVSEIEKKYINSKDTTVLDIGCNDGILLKNYTKQIKNIVGIEPSNAFLRIKNKKINVINKFFNFETTKLYLKRFNKAKIITITNVLAHIDDINGVIKNIKKILDKKGILIIEFPYVMDMLKKGTFDLVYHEHLSYLGVTSIKHLLIKNNLKIIDIKKLNFGASGPSLRVYAAHKNFKIKEKIIVKKLLSYEDKFKIKNLKSYRKFSIIVKRKIETLKKKLIKLNDKNITIACYTAPAKGNTLLNALNLKNKIFSFVTENNRRKINKYTPGTHIKIVDDNYLIKSKIKYALLLSWNYKKFFIKNSKFIQKGGKFILPF